MSQTGNRKLPGNVWGEALGRKEKGQGERKRKKRKGRGHWRHLILFGYEAIIHRRADLGEGTKCYVLYGLNGMTEC